MSNYQYVPARTNHLLHLILTFCTFGLWLPVWIIMTLHNHNRMVTKLLPVAPAPVIFHPSGPNGNVQAGLDYGYLDRKQYGSAHWDHPALPAPQEPAKHYPGPY